MLWGYLTMNIKIKSIKMSLNTFQVIQNCIKVLKGMQVLKVYEVLKVLLVLLVSKDHKDQKGPKELMDWMEQEVQKAILENGGHKDLRERKERKGKIVHK